MVKVPGNYVDTPPPPLRRGSTYCFTDVGVRVTPVTYFCYDLDLCSQGQAVRAFFIRMDFSLILSKGDFGQTCHKTS